VQRSCDPTHCADIVAARRTKEIEMSTLSEADRRQVILAAVAATGPDNGPDERGLTWPQRVAESAGRIAAMLDPHSEVSRAIGQVEMAKVFPATVVDVRREASSTRAIVTLRTKVSDRHPDGVETARSERTDDPLGLAMARRLTALRGHRVMLWVELQQMSTNTDRRVRIIRHVEDLGLDPSLPAPAPKASTTTSAASAA